VKRFYHRKCEKWYWRDSFFPKFVLLIVSGWNQKVSNNCFNFFYLCIISRGVVLKEGGNAPKKTAIFNNTSSWFFSRFLIKYSLSLHDKRKHEKCEGTHSHTQKIWQRRSHMFPRHNSPDSINKTTAVHSSRKTTVTCIEKSRTVFQ